jgi:hypothetical protein
VLLFAIYGAAVYGFFALMICEIGEIGVNQINVRDALHRGSLRGA